MFKRFAAVALAMFIAVVGFYVFARRNGFPLLYLFSLLPLAALGFIYAYYGHLPPWTGRLFRVARGLGKEDEPSPIPPYVWFPILGALLLSVLCFLFW
jgi:hypothetical protein